MYFVFYTNVLQKFALVAPIGPEVIQLSHRKKTPLYLYLYVYVYFMLVFVYLYVGVGVFVQNPLVEREGVVGVNWSGSDTSQS